MSCRRRFMAPLIAVLLSITPAWTQSVTVNDGGGADFTAVAAALDAVSTDSAEPNVITITGSVEMADAGGSRFAYDGSRAVLSLNGADQILDLMSGSFTTDLSIFTGVNRVLLRATGANGNTGVSEPLIVVGDFLPDDVVITLTWNSPTSDLDLHVWNPANEHCYFANREVRDGFLDIDDVNGFGPETFTATGSAWPLPILPFASATARSMTQRVSGRIRPVPCSARGMNSSGGTRPRFGWCQRSRASVPITVRVLRSTLGW